MDKKKVALKVASYATPYPTFARAFQSLVKLGKGVSAAIPKKDGTDDARAEPAAPGSWAAMSASEKFEHAYSQGGWTEEQVLRQYGAFRAAKFVQLVIGLALLPALVAVAITAPLWLVMFSVPVMSAFSVVLIAQAFRHAWWQCQIDLRAMITFKEFIGRSDLFARLFA